MRKTEQHLLPHYKPSKEEGKYDIYPAFPVSPGSIGKGLKVLAQCFLNEKCLIIDGYQGVFFESVVDELALEFRKSGRRVLLHDIRLAMKSPDAVDKIITPFLGGDDPLFGYRTSLKLIDFFDPGKLNVIKPSGNDDLDIIYGTGSALAGWKGTLLYIDLPKNEMQYRARAGAISNLGAAGPCHPKKMYKRFYFVDWVVLNHHKEDMIRQVDWFIDGQQVQDYSWMKGSTVRDVLKAMSMNVFRVRPWFEPGAWGGQWIKQHIEGLETHVPNYAWSFELIVPENGLLLTEGSLLMEISFDCLMYLHYENVLGKAAGQFGTEFPIRFDFLDTIGGGNLSVQCHPREGYIKEHFGENFAQQEAYYILDTKEDAMVNLGFKEDIDPGAFKKILEESAKNKTEVDIPAYIQQHKASKHELFLIPDGTVHGSGKNNLVLEISTTPYIFTFKMYDWLRSDLDGNPRDLNIERAFQNLNFDNRGDKIKEEFISRPVLIEKGKDWEKYHLPTHPEHIYDVYRYVFKTTVNIDTCNNCHILNLVSGSAIRVQTYQGMSAQYNYAETFVVPAAAGSYSIINISAGEAMVVLAKVK